MKTQFKVIARGINCTYDTAWLNDINSIKNAISVLKMLYQKDCMYKRWSKELNYFWLELYQSTKKEKELGNWTGGKLIATMGCKFRK